MPWCVFHQLRMNGALKQQQLLSAPLRTRAVAGNTLLFLQHNAFPSKMEGPNRMTNGVFCTEAQLFVFISVAGRIERTCFSHVSLKVLKENKSLGSYFKRPYWRMKLNAGLFEL